MAMTRMDDIGVNTDNVMNNLHPNIVTKDELAKSVYWTLIRDCDPNIKFPEISFECNSLIFEYDKNGVITQLRLNFVTDIFFNTFTVKIVVSILSRLVT